MSELGMMTKPWWRAYRDDPVLLLRYPILVLLLVYGRVEHLLARYHARKHPERGI